MDMIRECGGPASPVYHIPNHPELRKSNIYKGYRFL